MSSRFRTPSTHCRVEGVHGSHWVPEGMLGDCTVSDLCLGNMPPVAQVIYPDLGYHEVVEILTWLPASADGDRLVEIASATGARDIVPLSKIRVFP